MQKSSEKDLAIIYLKEAILNFNQAVQTIKDELMWNAFIQYNKARAQYILSLLLQSNDKTWETTMKTAIENVDLTKDTDYYSSALHLLAAFAQNNHNDY